MKIKSLVFVIATLICFLTGCAMMLPELSKASIGPKDIYGPAHHITLGLFIEGRNQSFPVHRNVSTAEFVQYTTSLQQGFAMAPVTDVNIFPYCSLKQGLVTGTKLSFDKVVMAGNRKTIPAGIDYLLSVDLTNAQGGQTNYSGDCSFDYKSQLLDKAGNIIAEETGSAFGHGFIMDYNGQFLSVREACGNAGKEAALDIIDWVRSQLAKQKPQGSKE